MNRPSRTRRRTCLKSGESAQLLLMKADRCWRIRRTICCAYIAAQDPTNEYYHWHIEFMPKLTKTAGFEWGTAFTSIPLRRGSGQVLREASVEDAVPSAVAAR